MTTPERDVAALVANIRALHQPFPEGSGGDGPCLADGSAWPCDAEYAARLLSSPDPVAGDGLAALWECYVQSGADTDRDSGPGALVAGMGEAGFARVVVESVKQLRTDYGNRVLDTWRAPLSSPVDRDAEIARIAAVLRKNPWPYGAPSQHPDYAIALYDAGLRSSPVEPLPGLDEAWREAEAAVGRHMPGGGFGVEADGPGYRAHAGHEEWHGGYREAWSVTDAELVGDPDDPATPAKALLKLAAALLPTQASDSKEQP